MPNMEVNGQDLYYVKEGSGPVILFIHSLGLDYGMWRDQFVAFENRYCCLAFDSRGHGGSDYSGPYSVGDLALDLKAALNELNIETVHVVGLAMGGPVALSLASSWPERVRSVVIANSFVDMRGPASGRIEATRKRLKTMSMHDFGKEYAETRLMPGTPKAAFVEIAEAIAEMEPEAYIDALKAIFEVEFSAELGGVKAPALVIFGDEDTVTPLHHAEVIRDAIPGAKLVIIPGAGHISNIDKPDEFNAALAEFLDAQPR